MAIAKKETTLVSSDGSLDISGQGVTMYQKINEYVKNSLIEGQHYGKIPGTNKPCIFKGGAEMINKEAMLIPDFEILHEKIDFDTPFFAYMFKCTLHKDGMKVSEGFGACSSKERKYLSDRTDKHFMFNTILKMAKKRAYVDATITAWGLSGIFTQDMEDLEATPEKEEKRAPEGIILPPPAERLQNAINNLEIPKDEFKDLRTKYFAFKGIREMNEEQRHAWNKSQIGKKSTKQWSYRDWLKAIELLVYRESKLEFNVNSDNEIPPDYQTPQEKALKESQNDPEAKKILPHFDQKNGKIDAISAMQLKAIGKLCEMKAYEIKEDLAGWTVDQAGQAIAFLNDN